MPILQFLKQLWRTYKAARQPEKCPNCGGVMTLTYYAPVCTICERYELGETQTKD